MATSCSVSLNVCLLSISSRLIGGSQNGCDAVDVKFIAFVLLFSSDLMDDDDVAVAIHSSDSVTCDNFGRGRDACCRQNTTDVYNEDNDLSNTDQF